MSTMSPCSRTSSSAQIALGSFGCCLVSCFFFATPAAFAGPIMPGVMQIEALAQLSGIICLQMEGAAPGAVFFFAGVDGVKWKKPVVPGDTLVMEAEILNWKAKFGIAKATGRGYVDGQLAVEVKEMTFVSRAPRDHRARSRL